MNEPRRDSPSTLVSRCLAILLALFVGAQLSSAFAQTTAANANKTMVYTTNVIRSNSNVNLAISWEMRIYDATSGVPTYITSVDTSTLTTFLPPPVNLPMAVSDDNDYMAYVTGSYNDHNGTNFYLNLLNTKTNATVFSLGGSSEDLCFPVGVVVKNGFIYVVNGGLGTWSPNNVDSTAHSATCTGVSAPDGVNVYDLTGKEVLPKLTAGVGLSLPTHPVGIAAGQNYIYVTDSAGATLDILQPNTSSTANNARIVATVPAGMNPLGVAVTQDWSSGSSSVETAFVMNGGGIKTGNPTTTVGENLQAVVSVDNSSLSITPLSGSAFSFNGTNDYTGQEPIAMATSYQLSGGSSPTVTPLVFVADHSGNIYAMNVAEEPP